MQQDNLTDNTIFSLGDTPSELVVASNNAGKIREIREMVTGLQLLSLNDIGFRDEIDEPFFTFEENALTKASTIYRFADKNVFADDSGICVHALQGQPGVISAHYSGTRDDEQNLQKVLAELQGIEDRSAYYKAVICLIWEGDTYYFEGICEGDITTEKRGQGGFGYDPIFVPAGYDKTFAELSPEIKNGISHRGKAVQKMVDFLNDQLTNTSILDLV